MRQFVLILIALFTIAAAPAFDNVPPQQPQTAEKDAATKPTFKLKDARDIYGIAYDLARTFMTHDEWQAKVSEVKEKFQDWSQNNDGDAGLYLNCRLLIVGLSAAGGKIEKIKEGVVWVSLYKEFEQPLPSTFLQFANKNKDSLNRVLKDFTWDRVSEYIKNRQWRKDAEAKEVAKAKDTKDAADAR